MQFGSLFACDMMLTLYTSMADRPKFKTPMALWLVTELAVDAGIASALLWEFRKAREILIETRRALDRLTAVTIQSGAAAATLAGATLITYYIKPESNVAAAVSYPLRRVYVITLVCFFLSVNNRFGTLLTVSQLSNLNIRKSAKSFSTTTTTSGPGTTGDEREPPAFTCGEREPPTFTCWATDDSCGIHVHRTVHTPAKMSALNPDP
ncbi:hypothetical protein MVEN_01288500 [Mycena venus]|uniref:DUF6534 domain-containing protein n=1 Tax=Mycena venus TaxID=2733690 RepID=A0A8H6Y172_9AGAR|nr:hypothetical protein MVEN_01288500 [Mycena venus]